MRFPFALAYAAARVRMSKKSLVYQEREVHPEQQAILDAAFSIVRPGDVEGKERDIVAIFCCKIPTITGELLDRFPNVKVVGNHGVGYDHIDLQACKARSVRVGTTPDVLSGTTADMAFSLLLAAARRVVEGNAIAKNPNTTSYDGNWFGYQVCGATVGIVGLGRIGLEVAKRACGFDMNVLYHNRHRRPTEIEEQVRATYVSSLHELLRRADFVVAAVPGSKENFHLFGKSEFSAMKRTGVFVNIARGSLVDQEALVQALREGTIAAAGLDVTQPEPLPRDHPLLSLSNITITPHSGESLSLVLWIINSWLCNHSDAALFLGSATLHCRLRMVQMVMDNIRAALSGQQMPNEVTA